MKKITRILILVLALLLVVSGVVSAKNNAASGPIALQSMCYLGDGSQGRMRLRSEAYRDVEVTWVAEWSGETGKVLARNRADTFFIVPRKSNDPGTSTIKITYSYDDISYSSSVQQNSISCDSNCPRADIPVIIDGGWSGIPVKAWVADAEQPLQYTGIDASGQPAALFSFYPDAGDQWAVRVEPQLPAGLDPARWKFEPATASVTIMRCERPTLRFKLTGSDAAQPQQQSQPQQQQQPLPEVLPVTGHDGGWWQGLLRWLGLAR